MDVSQEAILAEYAEWRQTVVTTREDLSIGAFISARNEKDSARRNELALEAVDAGLGVAIASPEQATEILYRIRLALTNPRPFALEGGQ